MNPHQRANRRIQGELDELVKRDVLTVEQALLLKERYPTTAWDLLALVRVFTVLGAITAVAGLAILVRNHLNWWLVSELALACLGAILLAAGYRLKTVRGAPLLGESLELIGAIALQGLTVVLAAHYATGSRNWPGLAGWDSALLLALAYLTANRLVLWYACVNLFFFFGAETGYVSGWGAYWLGMSYPVRFLAAGIATLLLAWLHAQVTRGRWAGFSRVYAHFGLLIINLALWFLALFGYFEKHVSWSHNEGQRLAFSLLWAATAAASLYGGIRLGLKLLRAYGLTFLIINLYTFYFQFVAAHTGGAWFLHLLLMGGSLLWLGVSLERQRKAGRAQG